MARQWQIEQLRQQLMIGSKWEGEDFVFTQWNGRQMGLETSYHAFQRIIKNYNENRKEGEPELRVAGSRKFRLSFFPVLIVILYNSLKGMVQFAPPFLRENEVLLPTWNLW